MQKNDKEAYVKSLEAELSRILAAEEFGTTKPGKLIIEILEGDVNAFTNKLLSPDFLNDHMGYVDARAKANYAQSLLSRINTVKSERVKKELTDKIKAAREESDD